MKRWRGIDKEYYQFPFLVGLKVSILASDKLWLFIKYILYSKAEKCYNIM